MGLSIQKTHAVSIILSLVVIYLCVDIPGYLYDRTVLSALSYHIFHGNIFHLLGNCTAVFFLFGSGRFSWKILLSAYVIASAAYFVSKTPCIGFSNIIYAMVGLMAPPFYSKWWKSPSCLIFISAMAFCLVLPGISAATHIVSFCVGVIVNLTYRALMQSTSDYGKAKRQ